MDWNPITAVVSAITKPFADGYKARQVRKQAKETGKNKLAQAKATGETDITLTDAEWEAISAEKQDSTWKDEYVTIIVTYPLIGIMLGTVIAAFFTVGDTSIPDTRLLSATTESLVALKEAGVDMGDLMKAVVLAAIGLKVWRAK